MPGQVVTFQIASDCVGFLVPGKYCTAPISLKLELARCGANLQGCTVTLSVYFRGLFVGRSKVANDPAVRGTLELALEEIPCLWFNNQYFVHEREWSNTSGRDSRRKVLT